MATSTFSIPKPDRYIDGGNFNRFCFQFKNYVTFANIKNDNLHLLFLQLVDGITYDKLSTVELTAENAADAEAFCKTYSDIIYSEDDIRDLRFSLMSIRQREGESITDYTVRLTDISNKAFPDESLRRSNELTAFLQGVFDPTVKVKLYESGCSSYSEAVKLAKRIESAKNIVASSVPAHEDIFAVENSSTGPGPSSYANMERRSCFNCQAVGHIIRDCRQPRRGRGPGSQRYSAPNRSRQNSDGNVVCAYCKVRNHKADNCFKLQRDMRNNSFRVSADQSNLDRTQ